jgi:hypothetical protein
MLETHIIEKITPNGIVTDNGQEQTYDLIILAIGFRVVEFLFPIDITAPLDGSLVISGRRERRPSTELPSTVYRTLACSTG